MPSDQPHKTPPTCPPSPTNGLLLSTWLSGNQPITASQCKEQTSLSHRVTCTKVPCQMFRLLLWHYCIIISDHLQKVPLESNLRWCFSHQVTIGFRVKSLGSPADSWLWDLRRVEGVLEEEERVEPALLALEMGRGTGVTGGESSYSTKRTIILWCWPAFVGPMKCNPPPPPPHHPTL